MGIFIRWRVDSQMTFVTSIISRGRQQQQKYLKTTKNINKSGFCVIKLELLRDFLSKDSL